MKHLLLALTLSATPVLAHDGPLIPRGVAPAADVLGHIFFSVCHPSRPGMLEDRIVLAETAFGWSAYDAGTDHAYRSTHGDITVTLDGNVLAETCEMTIPVAVGGDGADLYADLEAHLSDDTDGDLPEAEFTDGGLTWRWSRYVLTYTEGADAFVISLEASS